MPKWTITVCCDIPMFANIDVEAKSEDEAIAKAIERAPEEVMEFDYDAQGPYYAHVIPELNTRHDDAGALDYEKP